MTSPHHDRPRPAGWYPYGQGGALQFWDGVRWDPRAVRRVPHVVRALLVVAAVLWLSALALPAYSPVRPEIDGQLATTISGAKAFGLGALLFWLPVGPWVAWHANVFSGLSALLMVWNRAPRTRLWSGVMAAALAPLALLFTEMSPDESGGNDYAVDPGAATWLWITSMVLIASAAVWWRFAERTRP